MAFGKIILLILILSIFLNIGCISDNTNNLRIVSDKESAIQKCISLCEIEKENGTNLNASPCIGNPIEGLNDWVCDIAHNPRQSIDDLPENQCSAFREGKSTHFVELDSECNVIKTY